MNLTRRAFLGGLLTLAVAPAIALPAPAGLTPLERAVEAIRHARLAYLCQRTGQAFTDIFTPITELRRVERDRALQKRCIRLAFMLARRDYRLLGFPDNVPTPRAVPPVAGNARSRSSYPMVQQRCLPPLDPAVFRCGG